MSAYTQVKVPTELVDEVDRRVGTMGYRSRQEFVRDAIKRRLDYFTLRVDPQLENIEAEERPIG